MLTYIVYWMIKANHRDFHGMSYERRHRDQAPFYLVALTFLTAFGMLGISLFWPYMIPFAITINQAAASHSSLVSMFLGAGAFVFPLMLLYAAINYAVLPGESRARAALISMRSDKPMKSTRGQAGHAGTDGC